jgi:hypothetical protein
MPPIELYAGTLAVFNDSMAEAIENALNALTPLPSAPQAMVDERRTLFIAIAQGVIDHLASKQAALQIEFDVGLVHVKTNPVLQVKH